jgi:hypothetical protein
VSCPYMFHPQKSDHYIAVHDSCKLPRFSLRAYDPPSTMNP